MAWNQSLPSNTTKIRNYPVVIPDNFTAIQQGDSTFQPEKINVFDRDTSGVSPTTPARVDNMMQIFSRQDGSNAELWVLDAQNPANEIQVTEDGKLGSDSTPVSCSNITIGGNTFSNNQNNLVWAYGIIPAGGGAVSGGMNLGTVTVGTVGSDSDAFTVPFTVTTNNTNYVVLATPISSRAAGKNNVRVVNIIPGSQTTGQFSLRMQAPEIDSTNRTDVPIQIMVVGGW